MIKINTMVNRWGLSLAAVSIMTLTGPAWSQDAPGTTFDAYNESQAEPIFDMNPAFSDGSLVLTRTDGTEVVLQRENESALLKFENDPEVWSLRITPGPGNK